MINITTNILQIDKRKVKICKSYKAQVVVESNDRPPLGETLHMKGEEEGEFSAVKRSIDRIELKKKKAKPGFSLKSVLLER